MVDKLKIVEVIHSHLGDGSIFLVDLKISSDQMINVFIDGDQGVTIDDCVKLSRAIESSLNRDEEDFELNVFSFGLGQALKITRQYVKNIGRTLHVIMNDSSECEGVLQHVSEEKIEILPDNKKRKKNQEQELESKWISFTDIKEAKIVIKF